MGIISGKGLVIPKTVLASESSWVVCFAENLVGWTVGGLLGWFWLFALFPNRCSNLDKAELDSFLFLPNVLVPVLSLAVGGWVVGSKLSGSFSVPSPSLSSLLTQVVLGGIVGLSLSLSSSRELLVGGGGGWW